jgi:di- and tripeptidase
VNGVVNALKQRWRQPTLSIHKVEVSGPAGSNNTVIPKSATAAVSMRIVPDQQLSQIIDNYRQFVTDCFLRLRSRNRFSMTIGHRADWWIADQQSDLYRLAAESIASEWGVQQPLHIREGGSIPAIPFLEKIFDARAVHIPMGQASDNAHLPDERMRLQNLSAGRKVIKRFLQGIHLI